MPGPDLFRVRYFELHKAFLENELLGASDIDDLIRRKERLFGAMATAETAQSHLKGADHGLWEEARNLVLEIIEEDLIKWTPALVFANQILLFPSDQPYVDHLHIYEGSPPEEAKERLFETLARLNLTPEEARHIMPKLKKDLNRAIKQIKQAYGAWQSQRICTLNQTYADSTGGFPIEEWLGVREPSQFESEYLFIREHLLLLDHSAREPALSILNTNYQKYVDSHYQYNALLMRRDHEELSSLFQDHTTTAELYQAYNDWVKSCKLGKIVEPL